MTIAAVIERAGGAEDKRIIGAAAQVGKLENEKDRARMIHEMELSGAVGGFSGALDNSSFGSWSSSLAQETCDAMSKWRSWRSWAFCLGPKAVPCILKGRWAAGRLG